MLQNYVAKGAHNLDALTSLLGDVIESGAWSHFTDQLGNAIEHESFQSFVTTPRWRGMGTSRDALVGWVREQDKQVAEQVEQAWRGEVPAARRHGTNQHSKLPRGGDSATGSTEIADGILARLKRDDPELAARVVRGEVSPNAAAMAKGWRKPRVLLTSPATVASAVRQHWTPDRIKELKEML